MFPPTTIQQAARKHVAGILGLSPRFMLGVKNSPNILFNELRNERMSTEFHMLHIYCKSMHKL